MIFFLNRNSDNRISRQWCQEPSRPISVVQWLVSGPVKMGLNRLNRLNVLNLYTNFNQTVSFSLLISQGPLFGPQIRDTMCCSGLSSLSLVRFCCVSCCLIGSCLVPLPRPSARIGYSNSRTGGLLQVCFFVSYMSQIGLSVLIFWDSSNVTLRARPLSLDVYSVWCGVNTSASHIHILFSFFFVRPSMVYLSDQLCWTPIQWSNWAS